VKNILVFFVDAIAEPKKCITFVMSKKQKQIFNLLTNKVMLNFKVSSFKKPARQIADGKGKQKEAATQVVYDAILAANANPDAELRFAAFEVSKTVELKTIEKDVQNALLALKRDQKSGKLDKTLKFDRMVNPETENGQKFNGVVVICSVAEPVAETPAEQPAADANVPAEQPAADAKA